MRERNYINEIENILSDGQWHSANELIGCHYRFSSYIHYLRKYGAKIETLKEINKNTCKYRMTSKAGEHKSPKKSFFQKILSLF